MSVQYCYITKNVKLTTLQKIDKNKENYTLTTLQEVGDKKNFSLTMLQNFGNKSEKCQFDDITKYWD